MESTQNTLWSGPTYRDHREGHGVGPRESDERVGDGTLDKARKAWDSRQRNVPDGGCGCDDGEDDDENDDDDKDTEEEEEEEAVMMMCMSEENHRKNEEQIKQNQHD